MSETQDAPREKVSGVLGVSLGFALIAGAVLFLVAQRTRAADGGELLASWFEPAELPFGLAVSQAAVHQAAVRGRGREMVLLASPLAPPEEPRKEPPKAPETSQAKSPPEIDWTRLPQGPKDAPPREVLLVSYPLKQGAEEIERLFSSESHGRFEGHRPPGEPGLQGGGIEPVGPEGGRRRLDSGALKWAELAPRFVHEREFERGGTFRDSIRVNLSTKERPLVLFARWSRGLPASKQRVEDLLASLKPK